MAMTENLRVPLTEIITREIHYDILTPIAVYAALHDVGTVMLESAHDEGYGLYSYIGVNPIGTLTAYGNSVTVDCSGKISNLTADPYGVLEQFAYRRKTFGFISYDAVRLKERLPDRHYTAPDKQMPDFQFRIYKTIIKFEHKAHKIIITHEGNAEELELVIKKINQGSAQLLKEEKNNLAAKRPLTVTSDVSDEEYIEHVKQAQEYIKAGDIFQVVLSRTFLLTGKFFANALDIYRTLRKTNPTPYLAFFQEADYAIASASPELLVGVKDRMVETVPIAGTCRADADIDELLHDAKENAEHVMLVDLARNDIGVVSEPGSVKVAEYKGIKKLSHVTHIISRVIGKLRKELQPLDALSAILPAGTLSGAPKIRAMEIIDELEHSRRGVYGGAIVFIDEEANITSSIAIRTAVIYHDRVEVRAGAGIVLDSLPEKEEQETRLKVQGIISILENNLV